MLPVVKQGVCGGLEGWFTVGFGVPRLLETAAVQISTVQAFEVRTSHRTSHLPLRVLPAAGDRVGQGIAHRVVADLAARSSSVSGKIGSRSENFENFGV